MKKFLIEAEIIGTRKVIVEAKNPVHAKSKFESEEYSKEQLQDSYRVDHIYDIVELHD